MKVCHWFKPQPEGMGDQSVEFPGINGSARLVSYSMTDRFLIGAHVTFHH